MIRTLSAVAALAALLWIGPAQAENPAAPMQGQMEQAEVSDQQLRQFVDAATEVQTVQQEYAAQIQSSEEADEAQSLRQEAQDKMVEAVEDAGLTVSEYNLIAQQLQQDPALAERLNDMHSP